MVRLLGGALLVGLALAACGGAVLMTAEDGPQRPAPSDNTAVPEGAIPVGDDVYMVPLGKDGSGCEMYRAFSPTKAVVQAIHYRAADGRFTINQADAACAG